MGNNTWNKLSVWIAVLSLGVLVSCRPQQAAVSAGGASAQAVSRAGRTHIISEVVQHQAYYTTFNGRAKSRITLNDTETHDVNLSVRIASGKAIWISVTALMGVEAGRALITPDSIKIMNRLKHEYLAVPFDTVYSFTGSKLSFDDLQALLTGNVAARATGRSSEVRLQDSAAVLSGKIDHGNTYRIRLNNGYRPDTLELSNPAQQYHVEAVYSGYQTTAGRSFPETILLSIAAGRLNAKAGMNYSRVSFDETLELPFAVPPSYKPVQ